MGRRRRRRDRGDAARTVSVIERDRGESGAERRRRRVRLERILAIVIRHRVRPRDRSADLELRIPVWVRDAKPVCTRRPCPPDSGPNSGSSSSSSVPRPRRAPFGISYPLLRVPCTREFRAWRRTVLGENASIRDCDRFRPGTVETAESRNYFSTTVVDL